MKPNEIKQRLQTYGANEIAEKPNTPWWKKFIAQFKDFMVLVLLAATLIQPHSENLLMPQQFWLLF